MVKQIAINVTYNKNSQIITCPQHEFAERVADRFKVDFNNVVLYAVNKGEKYRIKPRDVADLMKIEMIQKKDGQRTLRSYIRDDSDSSPIKSLDSIITKLRQNSPLTGSERKSLIEWLEEHSPVLSKKRKLHERDDIGTKSIAHKKVQVNIASAIVKDSVTQTDRLNIALDEANKDEHIIDKMKKLVLNRDSNKEELAALMRVSFDDRRNFILLKYPTVLLVRNKYPALFYLDEVKNDLDRIFYPGKCYDFLSNMEKYANIILEASEESDEIVIRTKKSIQHALTPQQKTYATIVGSVLALPKLLDEEFQFIHLSDYPHGSDDVYPHIDASCYSLKDIFFDGSLFHIKVEGEPLCDAPNFPEAILCLVASFFIFSISYPPGCCRTLTVFEKVFLCANDTKDIDGLTAQMIKFFALKG